MIFLPLIQENNLTAVTEFFLSGIQSSQAVRIFLFCLLLVAYCGTLFGNQLIIILVSISKNLHTPMYFFISQLSFDDILLNTETVPNTLHILLNNGGFVTFAGCMAQFCFQLVSGVLECFLLTVMSYDRYVAICKPLRYTSIMTSTNCVMLVGFSWLLSFSVSLFVTLKISILTYCGPNIIDHFLCDVAPLVEIACSDTYIFELEVRIVSFLVLSIPLTIIIISYINIMVTILRFQSSISRRKAFSTCSSHLTVVSIYFLTPLSVYAFPTGGQTFNIKKLLSLLYTALTPLINPLIYSLRNEDISKSLQDIIHKYITGKNGKIIV